VQQCTGFIHRSANRNAIGGIIMTAKAKTTEETLEAGYSPVVFATLAINGAGRVIEASKTWLNLAARQNADVLAAIKKALKGTPLAELPILDLTGQAVEGFVAIQNELLDLSLEQINAVINAMLASGTDIEKAKYEFANVLQTSADRASVAQNSVIEYAAKQTKAGIDAVKAQPGIAGTEAEAMAERIQSGFDTVIATQKELIGKAAKQLKAAAQA
jgi:hypothetical protein